MKYISNDIEVRLVNINQMFVKTKGSHENKEIIDTKSKVFVKRLLGADLFRCEARIPRRSFLQMHRLPEQMTKVKIKIYGAQRNIEYLGVETESQSPLKSPEITKAKIQARITAIRCARISVRCLRGQYTA